MKKDSKVEFLREKNLEKTIELIKEKGKFAVLSEYSAFFDMRTYFKVNEDGDIFQKSYNPITLLYLFCDDEENLAEYLFKYSYPEEKQNIKKIDRTSNLDIESLKKNLIKTLVNSHLDFSKTFAKELFLRDKKAFFETMYNFALMGNPKDLKLFFVYALEEIFSKIVYDENIFYTIIAYLTKFRDDYSTYMEASNISFDVAETYSDDKKIYISIFEKVLERYNGGSFNPMHIGHEKIVDYILKNLDMDKIIIIPVGIPSHRENNLEQSDTRLKICKEIFKNNKKVEVSDIEIKSEGKSYTYDTLLKLIEIYGKDNEFFEIIGEDSLKNLKTWRNYKELLNLSKFIVFRRKDDKDIEIDPEFLNNKNIIILENEYYDISATEIRNKVKNSEDITRLVNKKVKKLIEKEYID